MQSERLPSETIKPGLARVSKSVQSGMLQSKATKSGLARLSSSMQSETLQSKTTEGVTEVCGFTGRSHRGGRSHRISSPSFCSAWLKFSFEKDSAVSFPRRS